MNKRYVRLLTNAEIDMLERIIKELKDVAITSKMEKAQFTDEIKQVTKTWRETWITEPVENSVGDLESLLKKLKRVMKEDSN